MLVYLLLIKRKRKRSSAKWEQLKIRFITVGGAGDRPADCNESNLAFFSDGVSEDISWHIVGDRYLQGKPAFLAALEQMKNHQVAELIIHKIITHGREGVANGELTMSDGKRYAYCDINEFSGAKGKGVRSIHRMPSRFECG